MNTIIGLIPVKGNSDRVLKKNTRVFADTNLLELKLSQIKKVKELSSIVVSSEDKDIIAIAKNNGLEIHQRNPYFSTSFVPMSEVYSNIASEISGENIAWINVTNPLAEPQIYSKAIKTYLDFKKNEYDCLLSVYEIKENFFYKKKPVNFKPYPWPRSQDLVGLYSMSFVINILKRQNMINWGSCVGNKPYFYILDKITSWDIDDQVDFDFCENFYKKKLKKNKN